MAYTLVEPAPTTLPNHYTHTGRGGAGNMYKPSSFPNPNALSRTGTALSGLSKTSTSSSLSKSSTSSTAPPKRVSAGRGGAGNIRLPKEEEPFSFAEEVRVQMRREERGEKWIVGRGGAGNYARREGGEDRKAFGGWIGGALGRS